MGAKTDAFNDLDVECFKGDVSIGVAKNPNKYDLVIADGAEPENFYEYTFKPWYPIVSDGSPESEYD